MKMLAIDTSGQTAGVAVSDGYITIGEMSVNTQGVKGLPIYAAENRKRITHSDILLPMIDKLLAFTGLSLEAIDMFACVSGPGSFTGLRIGLATAQGLAKGMGKPLVPVSALDALAYNTGCTVDERTLIVPMMDARRAQVYVSIYRRCQTGLKRMTDYRAVPVSEVFAMLNDTGQFNHSRAIFLGDGALAYENTLREAADTGLFSCDYMFAAPNMNLQRASSVSLCALRKVEDAERQGTHDCFNPDDFRLAYIRKPQAERVREEREQQPLSAPDRRV